MKRFILLLFSVCTLSANAQQMQPSDIPTPTAASLGRYGDIPVSYYTGRANVSIPIHTLSAGGVELPITLDYDGSGVQANTLPSWTGHNWTLNAGGVITRKKNGECDEWECTINNYYIKGYAIKSHFANYGKITPQEVSIGEVSYEGSLPDLQPDEFIFNFMGKQGRFFLGNDGQWKVLCDEDIDVLFDINDSNNFTKLFPYFPSDTGASDVFSDFPQSTSIKGFVLRDRNGISYHFGGANATEYTIPFFTKWETGFFHTLNYDQGLNIHPGLFWNNENSLTSWMPNSWYLTDVIDRYGNVLYHFCYEKGYYIAQFYNTCEAQFSYAIGKYDKLWSAGIGNTSFPWDGTLSTSVYLSKIATMDSVFVNFETGDFPFSTEDLYPNLPKHRNTLFFGYWGQSTTSYNVFYYLNTSNDDAKSYQYPSDDPCLYPLKSTRLKYLKSLSIKSLEMDGESNKHYGFDFGYKFFPRMFLTAITKRALGGILENSEKYMLEYHGLDKLPEDYLTTASDHWGYYKEGGEYQIDETSLHRIHLLRNPNRFSSQYGSLKRITYPTGGWSTFQYEQNDFSRSVSLDRQSMRDSIDIAGGLRIKSIAEYDHDGSLLKRRTFSYNDSKTGKSSGELFAAPCYIWENYLLQSEENPTNQYSRSFVRISSIIPLSNSFGPHVGYSCVTETHEDGSMVRYRYSNISAAMDERYIGHENMPLSPYEKYSEKGFMRGKLLSQEFFDKNKRKVRSVFFKYRNDNNDYESQFVYASDFLKFSLPAPSAYAAGIGPFKIGGIYKIFYPKYDPMESQDTLFFDNGKTVVTSHIYNRQDRTLTLNAPYGHETNIRPLLSETVARNGDTQITEYLLPFSSSRTLEREQLAGKEFFVKPIGETLYINGNKIKTEETHYESFNAGNKTFIAPKKMVRTSFPTTGSSSSATEEVLVTYHSYTPVGQVERYQKLGGPMTTLLWNNLNNTLAAICMGGVPVSVPHYTLDKEELDRRFDQLRRDNPHLQITSYTSSPLYGITSITQPNGNRTYFNYDGFFRLTDVRDHNNHFLNRYDYNYKK